MCVCIFQCYTGHSKRTLKLALKNILPIVNFLLGTKYLEIIFITLVWDVYLPFLLPIDANFILNILYYDFIMIQH